MPASPPREARAGGTATTTVPLALASRGGLAAFSEPHVCFQVGIISLMMEGEEPFIAAHSETVLEAGMVVAFEPGCYEHGEGVRVEQVVLVTADGCEVLSGHGLEL